MLLHLDYLLEKDRYYMHRLNALQAGGMLVSGDTMLSACLWVVLSACLWVNPSLSTSTACEELYASKQECHWQSLYCCMDHVQVDTAAARRSQRV